MKISYKKLWIKLIEKDIKKVELRALTGISTGTLVKLNKNENVALSVLLNICEVLKCDIGDICSAIPQEENKTTNLDSEDNTNDRQ